MWVSSPFTITETLKPATLLQINSFIMNIVRILIKLSITFQTKDTSFLQNIVCSFF